MAKIFLDSNIFLRHLLQDIPDQSSAASELIAKVETGEIQAHTFITAITEVVFTLERTYRVRKPDVADNIRALLQLPGLRLPLKRDINRACDLYVDRNVSFADALHAVQLERLGIDAVASYDRDFDRIPGVRRVDPRTLLKKAA